MHAARDDNFPKRGDFVVVGVCLAHLGEIPPLDVVHHLSLPGCFEASLECGRRLGICAHPKTIRRFRKNLARDNKTLVNALVSETVEKHQLAIIVIDDFHSVHTIPRSTSPETFKALHMATSTIDVHHSIQSIHVHRETSSHFWPSDNTCRGFIYIYRSTSLSSYIHFSSLRGWNLCCLPFSAQRQILVIT